MDSVQTEVVVVGGGPVGLGLAIELGRRDIPVVLIERERSLHHVPKGQNLTQRTMEHFRSWDVEERIRAARVMPADYPAAGVNAYGSLMSEFAHPWFRRSEVDRYYFATNERLPQYLTESVLRDRVAELPSVTGLFGSEAQSIREEPTGVVVETEDLIVEGTYAVGCDGSHSTTRRSVGIGEEQTDHSRRMVLVVFRSAELHRLLEERFGKSAFFNVLHPDLDGYWRFLGRVDVGEGWFFHAPVPPETTAESLDHRRLLAEAVGCEFELELDYLGFWDLRIAIADTYQTDRVFIAGDAAHSHPPYGGYGINSGLEDVRNLGWKIAANLQGWAGQALLATYTQERRPVFVSTARDFIAAFIEDDRAFIRRHDPGVDPGGFAAAWERRRSGSNHAVHGFEPHYEGSPIVFGPPDGTSGAIGRHSFQPRPGHHLPPPAPDGRFDLFGVLGNGFTLIGESPRQVAEFDKAASDLGIPLCSLTAQDHADILHYGSLPILVRPDHFISWVGDGDYSPDQVLRRSVGRGGDPG